MSGKELIRQAIAHKESLTSRARVVEGRGKQAAVLVARALRYLKREPDGMSFRSLFLMSTSRYEMAAAAKLVCPREDVIDLVDRGRVPVTWLVDGSPRRSAAYTFWYNRILSRRPSAIYTKRRAASKRTSPASVSVSKTPTFFHIKDHEFSV